MGGRARLECQVYSSGEVTVWWERNGKSVGGDDDVTVTVKDEEKISELTINELKDSDFGDYRCSAENDVGTAHRIFRLKIRGRHAE